MGWFNEGCQIGCEFCQGPRQNLSCYTQMEPTLDPALRTFKDFFQPEGIYKHNPWFAPGHAPVYSPCGLSGGSLTGHAANGGIAAPGYSVGFDGRELPSVGTPVEWVAGSVQSVSWRITGANHGGGYGYRLCPATSVLTEDCFQTGHLGFHGDIQWIRFGNGTTVPITANRTASGTRPSNSQWTKNPIPACAGESAGFMCIGGCTEPQFEPPIPGLWGLGPGGGNGCNGCKGPFHLRQMYRHCKEFMDFDIVDEVFIPQLEEGDYILSFRWESEQTPQVWTQCADVKIMNNRTVV